MTVSRIIDIIKHNAIAKDSSWAVIGSAMGKALSLVAGIVIARMLGADVFGEYGMIKSTLAYVATFSTFGLGYTATKYIAQCKPNDTDSIHKIIVSSIRITIATSGIMAILLLLFANRLSVEPHLIPVLRYTALIIIFNAVNTTQLGLLSGFKDFKTIAVNNTIVGITTFVLGTLLTYFFGLDGAVTALFTSTVIQCLLNHLAVRRHYRSIAKSHRHSSFSERLPITKELLVFSLPIALQECVYASSNWLRMLVLVKLAGYDELGLYTASNQWFIMILFIPGVLRNVILSHLSSSADDMEHHAKTFDTMLKINIVATLIPAMVIAIASPLICHIYGESFDGFLVVLLIAIATSIFGCIAGIYTQEFISRGKNWIILWAYIIREVGALALAYPFLLSYGNRCGASVMYGTVLLMHILYCAALNHKYKNISNRNV